MSNVIINRDELIKGDLMEKALIEAAEIKKTILTTYKEQDKGNFEQFYETCLNADPVITEILGKRKKNQTEVEKKQVKDFKKRIGKSYKAVCDLLLPEDKDDENSPTKFEKIVDKVANVIDYLRYIGSHELDEAFEKRGLKIESVKLESRSDVWADDSVKENIKNIFNSGKKVRENTKADTQVITEEILLRAVPQELVYEKDSNPVGLKKGDWAKLVDFKTKLLMAKEAEQKEKIEDQASDLAAEKQFDQERARLMQIKLTSMDSENNA